jgi:GT2 family glycosyltransferase
MAEKPSPVEHIIPKTAGREMNQEPQSKQLTSVGIGITTKDRWEDLVITLAELRKQGYGNLETIVIDDGSQVPLPAIFREQFPNIRFERSENSLGLVVQRNRLAQMLRSTYYLSLDDDSFPVDGDLNQAVEWIETHQLVVALALQVVERDAPVPALESLGEPYQVRGYIGCAHLVHRERFLQLGGYLEPLHYFCEELEFCFKALRRGLMTYAYPGLVVRHNITSVARNTRKKDHYYTRNEVILGLLYFPFPLSILRAANCLRMVWEREGNPFPGQRFLGWLEGWVCGLRWHKLRRPLSMEQFRVWKKLPFPPRYLGKTMTNDEIGAGG